MDDFKEEDRKSCQITENMHASIEKVRSFIENDPYCTFNEIEAEATLHDGTIEATIHEQFKKKKLVIREVLHELT